MRKPKPIVKIDADVITPLIWTLIVFMVCVTAIFWIYESHQYPICR